jgi:2-methylcitrate dehydratase PrpD
MQSCLKQTAFVGVKPLVDTGIPSGNFQMNNQANRNLTAPLAAFAAELTYDKLPPEVVRQASRFLLDAVGCAFGAWREEPRKASLARQIVDDFAATGGATLIGSGQSHPAVVALGNGILINATDNDDTHKRALAHIGSAVVPAALAMVESTNGSGRDLITALVAGYEVMSRVGMAVMPTHYRFWHSTATNGTFGAAAAAGSAMRLDPTTMRGAFGFAGTQAAGLNTFFESGDDSKSVHPGKAAFNGVLAARMASLGVTSPPDIFGHPKGYLAAYSLEAKPEMLTSGLGTKWTILDNGFKFYPSILASHSPIGATLKLVEQHRPDPQRILSVKVRTYETVKTHFSSKEVGATMAARLSVPYCVAIALVDRQVTQRQFAEDRFQDPLVRTILACTEIEASADLTALYPEKFPAQVTVTMESGEQFTESMYYPKGDPSNPLSDEELLVKFKANVAGTSTDPDRLVRLIEELPTLERISSLGELLRGSSR